MENLTNHITEILILLFVLITFMQSGIDKMVDWKANIEWLKGHFSDTFLSGSVPFMVGVIAIIEIITGILAILGILWILAYNDMTLGFYSCILACLTLIMLLFGQRVAKDYAGAFTLTGYFIVCIIGVYILN
ncbi:DoxX family protein [Gramella sp. AN32]|uniref:DoxX family protein n=1 Tax=Christiangramia antarctica TaxID=2058158 RepID=A0ABW5WZV0_9FLAO|nr:DoxX family protein [Gramella sp. AN32]MCM4155009.1 DoxX family protein [Gramella sp. AN32]